ncbi:MAG: hypothetical protein M0D53_17615 [Flavobacterium sp. JAD_PAG50586_2]|nr:MAG: hypothetical protein M0D53_17615 [Flavobacterium sp. JAD_PAG50586_2]
MKKTTLSIMLFILSLCIFPTTTFAAEPVSNLNKTEVPAEVKVMYDRLEEIKKMDKSEMTRAEKKNYEKKFAQSNLNCVPAEMEFTYLLVLL